MSWLLCMIFIWYFAMATLSSRVDGVYMIYRRQRGQINQTKKKKKNLRKILETGKNHSKPLARRTRCYFSLFFIIFPLYLSALPPDPHGNDQPSEPFIYLALPFQSHIFGQSYAKIPPCCCILQLNLGAVRQKTAIFQGMKHLQNPVPMRYRPRGLVHTQLFVTASVRLCCCENNNQGGRKCYYQCQ